MRRYDYSFIKDMGIQTGIVTLMKRIAVFKVDVVERKKNEPEIFAALESIAKIQSIKGSNEIEGIVTTDKRIKEIVVENSAPRNHDEEEIAGYRDVLNMIHNDYRKMKLDEESILKMHGDMMSHTEEKGGQYKEDDNVIINIDRQGNKSIRFRPVTSEETQRSMEQLILAYIVARDDSNIDNTILIPCFILDFLCIHPFMDGNGRMSRLLSLLLMYKSGIDVGKYISFEAEINKYKGSYYDALQRSSKGWHTNENDYLPFIEHFILTLFTCYKELDRRFEVVGDKKLNKGNRVEAAILKNLGSISKKEIRELLPDVSITTIEAKLTELLKEGKIEKFGSYKDARYARK